MNNHGLSERQKRLLAEAAEENDSDTLLVLIDAVLAEFDNEVELPDLHQVMEVLRTRTGA